MIMAKRKVSGIDMADRNKRIKKEEEDQSQNTYTSQLPELVINQIVSHLSTKSAAKASILSKEWASFCYSVPVLDIDEEEGMKQCADLKDRSKKFLKFLSYCVKVREKEKDLEKLRLRMNYTGTVTSLTCVSKLLSFALERNVKELDICFIKKIKAFCLHQTALSNAKCLAILKLENLRIEEDSNDAISFPSLKTLSLNAVRFTTNTGFSSLYSGCPSVEYLSLTFCHGWIVRLSSSKLKHLEVLSCESKLIEIEATNLESFKFRGDYGPRHHSIDMSKSLHRIYCPNLRSLELSHVRFKIIKWFERLISRFPLERLVLHSCFSHGVINISNQHLKSFRFYECGDILRFFSMTAPNLLEATVTIEQREDYDRLRNFLGHFGSSKKLRLHVSEIEVCIFSEEFRKKCSPPLPSLKHLEVEIDSFTTGVTHSLMDSLRWMAPSLEFLSINRILYIYDSRTS